jgi:hypothetical protein
MMSMLTPLVYKIYAFRVSAGKLFWRAAAALLRLLRPRRSLALHDLAVLWIAGGERQRPFDRLRVTVKEGSTNGNQVTITDTNPIPPQEFYRIGISLP